MFHGWFEGETMNNEVKNHGGSMK